MSCCPKLGLLLSPSGRFPKLHVMMPTQIVMLTHRQKLIVPSFGFANIHTKAVTCLHNVSSAPAEHLLMKLQQLDCEGSALRDLDTIKCTFAACNKEYMQMLMEPDSHEGMQSLGHHFEPDHLQGLFGLMQTAFVM